MGAQFKFVTTRFDNIDAEPKADDYSGQCAVLAWSAQRLAALGLTDELPLQRAGASWYFNATVFAEPYRFQCGPALSTDPSAGSVWRLTVNAQRSVIDRLLGRRELTPDNAVLRIVMEWLQRESDFADVTMQL